jgi:hypothetical protein
MVTTNMIAYTWAGVTNIFDEEAIKRQSPLKFKNVCHHWWAHSSECPIDYDISTYYRKGCIVGHSFQGSSAAWKMQPPITCNGCMLAAGIRHMLGAIFVLLTLRGTHWKMSSRCKWDPRPYRRPGTTNVCLPREPRRCV